MGLYEHWPYTNFHELNLNWIIEEIKTVEEQYEEVKQLAIDLEELKEKYIEIYELYEKLESDFDKFKEDVNEEFSDLQEGIEEEFAILSTQIQNEFRQLSTDVQTTLNAFDIRLIDMNIKLDYAIENMSELITMINPFTGETVPVAQVIYQLASFHMENAITAGEYDALNLSAGSYDALRLTAYQYDVNGKNYLIGG